MCTKVKRVKPTREQVEKTRRTRGAKEQMYAQMVAACIKALINRDIDILITFPYFVKFQKDFPKGILVEKTANTNTYKVKTRKLLDWLHAKGYSKHDSEDIMKASRDFNYRLTRLENQIDNLFIERNDDGTSEGIEEQTETRADQSGTEAGSSGAEEGRA